MAFGWKPYVSVAKRRAMAEREVAKLSGKGHSHAPVTIQGRKLTTTFWGKAWCDNLEAYSDFSNRLPRGRTYVRNGSVVDLQVIGGEVKAKVMGSEMYTVRVKVSSIAKPHWDAICQDCSGSIDSVVELLQGRLSKAVMERVCRQKTGLFPAPAEIELSCSCPDWASMCKHVAAVLYGIGARLDEQPALLFKLRAVDEQELIASTAKRSTLATAKPASAKVLDDDALSALFEFEVESSKPEPKASARTKDAKRPAAAKKSLAQPAPAAPVKKPRARPAAAAPAKAVKVKARAAPASAGRKPQSKR